MAENTVIVKIRRLHPGEGAEPRWEEYQVPAFPGMNVLDTLFWVQRNPDPSLAFRCACRVGMCGSCGIVINGTEGLACRTLVATLGEEIRLQPMRNMPVIKDLVVDMGAFFDKYQKVIPYFTPAQDYEDLAPISPQSKEREAIDEQRECIACGLCYSSCDVVMMNETFLGPAALNRAYALVADSRDGAAEERLHLISNESGLWRCHTLFNCTAVCPKGINPTQAIERLKRKLIFQQLQRVLTPWRRK